MMEQGTSSRACHLPAWPEAWGLATEGVDMTENRRSKRATRSRMAETGEKYTDARRALLASGGDGGRSGEDPGVTIAWPEDALGWFTDQAHNAILLAEDEARMMNHSSVDPEHLLLAAARRGNAESLLLTRARIAAREIHDAILRHRGFGEKLVLHPRPSPASEEVLSLAVSAALARGVSGPSTEHLLLALGEQEASARILAELGLRDVRPLVDAKYPVVRAPLDQAFVQRRAPQLAGMVRRAPSPGPIPPIFERFTSQARDAIDTGIEHACKLDAPRVEVAHLLYGVLDSKTGVVATVRSRHSWDLPPAQIAQPSYSRATRATGPDGRTIVVNEYADIFSDDARRIVAEDVLIIAERLGQSSLTTGHLLVAILESPDEHTGEITRLLPDGREITAAVIDALPGQEEP
jgi:Clp amino terminal domain, pathogenicity island component